MAQDDSYEYLSRRERQIMDILYRLGRATAAEIRDELPDPPSYSAVRAAVRVLEEKGHVEHTRRGRQYVFSPTVPRDRAQRTAARRLLETYFDGSAAEAMAALLDETDEMPEAELRRLEELVEAARKEGR